MSRLLRWGPLVFWAGLIFLLSHQPGLPVDLGSADWLAHSVAFGVLALTLLWALSDRGRQRFSTTAVAGVWVVSVVYGVLDEFHQSIIPNRNPSLSDVVADAVGALLFLWAGTLVLRARLGRA